jgi:hypothetical protein
MPLIDVTGKGQSIWLDYIQREVKVPPVKPAGCLMRLAKYSEQPCCEEVKQRF